MKSSFCIDLQRFMLIPTKFPLTHVNFCIIFFLLTFVDINQKNYKIFCCKNNYL